MGFPGEVDILRAGKENGTPTLVMAVVDGESMGALIGRRGETLQAFQFISQLLVNRRVGHWTRVLLDIEGYRSRRERYLKDTALRAAEKAMRYRESIELDPMIPSERRIVHLTLADHEFVVTHSEGEGDNRRVIVEPTSDYVAQHGGPPERAERLAQRVGAVLAAASVVARGGRGRPRRLRRWRRWRRRRRLSATGSVAITIRGRQGHRRLPAARATSRSIASTTSAWSWAARRPMARSPRATWARGWACTPAPRTSRG